MARDGNGNYSLPEAPFIFDTVIDEAAVNNNFSDIGGALTQSLSKDGQTIPTSNLPMGGRRHTNVADASSRNEYPAVGQVQDGAFTWCGAATGTANALMLLPSPPITAHVAGQRFWFVGAAENTDAVTVAISGLPVRDIQIGGAALTGGEILAGELYQLLDDGAQLQLSRISPTAVAHGLLQAADAAAARAAIGAAGDSVASVLAGTVIDYTGSTGVPDNYLFADGRNVLRAEWPELFAVYGTYWGAGDGSTTFGIPDLRGRVTAALDGFGGPRANRLNTFLGSADSLGSAGGAEGIALAVSQLAPHTHGYAVTDGGGITNPPEGIHWVRRKDATTTFQDATTSTGQGEAHANVQPTMVVFKLIYAGQRVPQ